MNSSFFKPVAPLLFFYVTVGLVLAYLNLQLDLHLDRLERPEVYDNAYLLPGPRVLEVASLNHRTAAASLVWCAATLHVGTSIGAKHKAPDATLYARTIIALDPYFYPIYNWHAGARMFVGTSYPTTGDIDAASMIYKEGMRHFPKDFQFPYQIAGNYSGFNSLIDDETRLLHLEDGAHHAEIAASLPGAPDFLPLLAANFHRRLARMREGYKEGEDVPAAATQEELAFLERLYILTPDEHIRIFIQRSLEKLGHGDFVENQLRRQHQHFIQTYSQGMNYLSPELFTLIDGSLSATTHIDDLRY